MSGKLVMGGVLGLVVGIGAGWLAGGSASSEDGQTATKLVQVEGERDALVDELTETQTELESAKLRVARLDRELSTARASLAEAEAAAEEVAAAPEPEVPEHLDVDTVEAEGASGLGVGQRFSFPAYDEHLAAVDWTEVGRHVGAMAPLLAEIFDAVSRNEQPSPEAIGGVQQHNGPLVTVAMKLKDNLPGETVNGAFSHPSAVVNMIASTLEALGKPLSEAQLAEMQQVGNDFVAEDERRLQSYGEDAMALRRHADESLLKGRFYAAATAVLTDEQHDLLRPEAVRDRVTADLFSASIVWVGRAQPVPFQDRADLAETLTQRISRDLSLEGESKERLAATIAQWSEDLPDELVTREPDALWLRGLLPIDVIDLAAEQQLVLMERMILEVDLPEEAIADLRGHTGVFVPTLRPQR